MIEIPIVIYILLVYAVNARTIPHKQFSSTVHCLMCMCDTVNRGHCCSVHSFKLVAVYARISPSVRMNSHAQAELKRRPIQCMHLPLASCTRVWVRWCLWARRRLQNGSLFNVYVHTYIVSPIENCSVVGTNQCIHNTQYAICVYVYDVPCQVGCPPEISSTEFTNRFDFSLTFDVIVTQIAHRK